MVVQQVSVFLDNKPGRLAEMTRILSDAKVNIRALYVADTADYGILRMIVSNPEMARAVLKEGGFSAHMTPVFAISLADRPGGLWEVLRVLDECGVNVEYTYAFSGRNEAGKAAVVIKTGDITAPCQAALAESGVEFLTQGDIIAMCR